MNTRADTTHIPARTFIERQRDNKDERALTDDATPNPPGTSTEGHHLDGFHVLEPTGGAEKQREVF